MGEHRRLRASIHGHGEPACVWKNALLGQADLSPGPEDSDGGVDVVLVGPGSHDPFARAREALLAGRHVLYAGPFALSPWQAGLLSEFSSRQRRILRFVEPFQHQGGFPFLQRLLRGREPFWKPLYLRVLALGGASSHLRIDDLATEALALCESLISGRAVSVTATAVRTDDTGDVCASLLTVQYEGGPPVQCTVSLVETAPVRQLVAVAPDRTVVMDQLDPGSSLRIIGADLEGEGVSLTRKHAVTGGSLEREEIRRFCRAATTDDLSYGNAARWTRVAAIWSAARQAMSFGGSVRVPAVRSVMASAPPLRVIAGGGSSPATARRPALTIVG